MVLNLDGASAQNWDLCVSHSIIAAKDKRTPRVQAGDDIFVYVSRPRPALIGHVLAQSDKLVFDNPMDAPWRDGATYVDYIPVDVVTDRASKPITVTWTQLQALGGFAGQANSIPRISDPARVDALRQLVGSDVSVVEALMQGLLDDPKPGEDLRARAQREVVQRQGQRLFRRRLLDAYEFRCAVTGTAERDVLEAAHIRRYMGPHSNTEANGLLLRADIHTLFDLFLMTVELRQKTFHVVMAQTLSDTTYTDLAGPLRHPPGLASHQPAAAALAEHNREFTLREGARTAVAGPPV